MPCGPFLLPYPSACGGSGSATNDPCCGEQLSEFPDLTVTIPDGTDSGSYTAEYRIGEAWAFSTSPTTYKFRMSCVDGEMRIYLQATPETYDVSIASSCDPLLFTFPGDQFGATGDITVEL